MIPFIYRAIEVRTAQDTNGDPLFCLSDICKCLGLTNPSMVASQIKEEFQPADSKVSDPMLNMGEYSLPMREFQTTKGRQTFLMITEPQLYFVMMRSRTEYARAFRQWIYKEVLPCLRKTGGNPDAKGGNLRELMENAAYLLKLAGIEGNQLVLALDKVHKNKTGESLLALSGTQLVAPVQEQIKWPSEILNED